jgi:hypothetical protein
LVEETKKGPTYRITDDSIILINPDDVTGSLPDLDDEIVGPYLPPTSSDTKPYCLVLDLDETLIHYDEEDNEQNRKEEEDMDLDDEGEFVGFYLIRPETLNFLKAMKEHFEIVIFTAAMQDVSTIYFNTD